MGNVPSSYFEEKSNDLFWSNDALSSKTSEVDSSSQNFISEKANLSESIPKVLSEGNKKKLSEFKLELARKHEKRRDIIAGKRKEMDQLKEEIEQLKKENAELKASQLNTSQKNIEQYRDLAALRNEIEETRQLRKENEDLKSIIKEKSDLLEDSEKIINKNRELRISIVDLQKELQRLNNEVLNFEKEREDYRVHVVALKDVIAVSKHMLQIRESQLKELKEKVESIEQSLVSREATLLSENLRAEYEKQMANMRNLRLLYEERQRAERREKEEIASQLVEVRSSLEQENKKMGELESRISELELDNSKKYDEIKTLESNLGLSKAENRQYQAELAVINQLFSETLMRYNNSQEMDLDKLQKHLEEHHGLLKDIVVNEVSSEVSYALPKVLLELINQLHENEKGLVQETVSNTDSSIHNQELVNATPRHEMSSTEEIVENLPKVWRVLIELLSHQTVPTNILTDEESTEDPCYKKVETPKGTSFVLSVSQTFIRLKDLILEKKSLEKETVHLKHLNCHLENRLQDQEKRLELVQSELGKTWLVVGKLQKQHQLLHTQEKILRYELAQKRKLLNELKEELEYSREKWAEAREKNTSTEIQWKQLRTEFASRKKTNVEDANNSAESGYSDDREGLSDEEPGYETDVSECAQKPGEESEFEKVGDNNLTNNSLVDSSENKNSVAECIQKIEHEDLETEDRGDVNLPYTKSALKCIHEPEEETENESVEIMEFVENGSTQNSGTNITVSKCVQTPDDKTINEDVEIEDSSLPNVSHISEGNNSILECARNPKEQTEIDDTEIEDLSENNFSSQEGNYLELPQSISHDSTTGIVESDGPSLSSPQDVENTLLREVDSTIFSDSSLEPQLMNISSSDMEGQSSSSSKLQVSRETFEKMLAKREERLKKLENQAVSLVHQTTNTATRSVEISNKLDSLHELYGQSNDIQNGSAENTGQSAENEIDESAENTGQSAENEIDERADNSND